LQSKSLVQGQGQGRYKVQLEVAARPHVESTLQPVTTSA